MSGTSLMAEQDSTVRSAASTTARIRRFLGRNYIWVALAVLVLVLAAISPAFRNPANLENVLMQNGIIGIIAMGMLVMMISGGFDLSVGAAGGAVAVVSAAVSTRLGLAGTIAIALALGLAIGTINGLVIAKLQINSFITTFAIASIISGVLFVATNGKSVVGSLPELQRFAYGDLLGVPLLFLTFLIFSVLIHLFLTRTKWGHWLHSVGSNATASYLSGIPASSLQVLAFVIGGLAVGIGGLLLFGQSAIGQSTGAEAWPLNAIAICVIGGTSLSGGIGRVSNVFAAVLLLGVVSNGLNQLGVSPYWQPAVTGSIILAAMIAERVGQRR